MLNKAQQKSPSRMRKTVLSNYFFKFLKIQAMCGLFWRAGLAKNRIDKSVR
jgi:hypothetical protein